MTSFNSHIVKQISFIAILMTLFVTAVNAGESKDSVLNKYEMHGFECLDISETINEDTLKSYTDLTVLENADKVHVCVKIDVAQKQFSGNKYVFVFDQYDNMKTYNQIASIND